MQPNLSIIVPSYNMERFLPICLDSLARSGKCDGEVEVLVVNDGSKDRTSEIAHEYEGKYPAMFRVIDKPNGNYGSCINTALPLAKGKFVKILDADDSVVPEAFSSYVQFLECIEADDVDLVVSDYMNVDPEGNCTATSVYGYPSDRPFTLDEVIGRPGPWMSIHAIAYRREMLLSMNYRQTEGISYTDTEWYTLPMSRVRKCRYFPKIMTKYLVGRDGQTMNAQTFSQSTWMLERIAQNFVMRYKELLESAVASSREYFKMRVIDHFQSIYTWSLIGFNGVRSNFDIGQFDAWLKESQLEIYNVLNDRSVPSRFRFCFIAEWRRHRTANTMRFHLFRGYLMLMKLRSVLTGSKRRA